MGRHVFIMKTREIQFKYALVFYKDSKIDVYIDLKGNKITRQKSITSIKIGDFYILYYNPKRVSNQNYFKNIDSNERTFVGIFDDKRCFDIIRHKISKHRYYLSPVFTYLPEYNHINKFKYCPKCDKLHTNEKGYLCNDCVNDKKNRMKFYNTSFKFTGLTLILDHMIKSKDLLSFDDKLISRVNNMYNRYKSGESNLLIENYFLFFKKKRKCSCCNNIISLYEFDTVVGKNGVCINNQCDSCMKSKRADYYKLHPKNSKSDKNYHKNYARKRRTDKEISEHIRCVKNNRYQFDHNRQKEISRIKALESMKKHGCKKPNPITVKKYVKRNIDNISDQYVTKLLCDNNKDIRPLIKNNYKLINAKREQIKILRETKNK